MIEKLRPLVEQNANLAGAASPVKPTLPIRVGVAGWSYADWEGRVYPRPHPRGFDALSYLLRYLDVLEINTSFYRPVAPATAERWASRAAGRSGFCFTAKLHRSFTHDGVTDPAALRSFRAGLGPLQDAGLLGALLLQFPHAFHESAAARDHVARLADQLAGLSLVLEVRHQSWLAPAALDFLRARRIGFCNIDQPLLGAALPRTAIVTSDVGYVRLHGRNARNWFRQGAGRDARYDYLYEASELEPWVERTRKLVPSVRQAFVVANNHFEGKAVVNALELMAALRDEAVDVPPDLIRTYPRLASIARSHPPEEPRLPFPP